MRSTRTAWKLALALGTVAVIASASAPGAMAGTIEVTTTADEFAVNNGRCALREAIYAANNDGAAPASGCAAASGNDLIVLPAGRFELSIAGAGENLGATGDLDITDFVTITHSGIKPAVIDGNGIDRVLHTSATGLVRIVGVTITGGSSPQNGGGIFNDGTLTLDRVTLTGNSGQFGGGLATSSGTVNVFNTTFSGNSALTHGGGLAAFGLSNATSINSSTVTGNRADSDNNAAGDGGGIHAGVGSTSLRSVLVAGNVDPGGEAPDCYRFGGFFESSGNVLVANPTGCDLTTAGPGDLPGANPALGALAFNGGSTQTHLIGKKSAAINRGGGCPSVDQRGAPRKKCDIGAYERIVIRKVLVNRVGSEAGEKIKGTKKRDAILGLRGKDKLFGGKGKDVLVGGKGRDVCVGGPGKDVYKGCEVRKDKQFKKKKKKKKKKS